MSSFDLIRRRRSVRTFAVCPLKPDDARQILEYSASVHNPYAIPIVWKLLDAKEYGLSSPVILGSGLYIAGKMSRVPHAEEAFGYSFEKIVLFAESLGVGTTWIAGTMNRSAFEKALELSEGEVMPCVSPLGYPAKKMSLRESMMRKGIKADSRFRFEDLFFAGSFETPLSEAAAGNLRDALEAVRLAPSAVNKQPWRILVDQDSVHFYKYCSRGFISDAGWDIQKIDMGIALCHFELVASESGVAVSPVIKTDAPPAPEGMQYIASYSTKANA